VASGKGMKGERRLMPRAGRIKLKRKISSISFITTFSSSQCKRPSARHYYIAYIIPSLSPHVQPDEFWECGVGEN
jgi:hypothetical protein